MKKGRTRAHVSLYEMAAGDFADEDRHAQQREHNARREFRPLPQPFAEPLTDEQANKRERKCLDRDIGKREAERDMQDAECNPHSPTHPITFLEQEIADGEHRFLLVLRHGSFDTPCFPR